MQLGIQALSWITKAARPIHVHELIHALSVEMEDQTLEDLDLVDLEIALSVYAGLLDFDPETQWAFEEDTPSNPMFGRSAVRFTLKIIEEFMIRNASKIFLDADLEIAYTCLTCLAFEDFRVT